MSLNLCFPFPGNTAVTDFIFNLTNKITNNGTTIIKDKTTSLVTKPIITPAVKPMIQFLLIKLELTLGWTLSNEMYNLN